MSRANTRDLVGSIGLVETVRRRLLFSDKLYRLTVDRQILASGFLVLFISSSPGRFEFERDASGASGSMQNISKEAVRSLVVPVPPIREQQEINAFVHAESDKLGLLTGKITEAIDLLHEYRTALISAAVTGKIDVRETETSP
jgi:type I restriction enzyme S subunit